MKKKNSKVLLSLAAATVFGLLVAGCATYLMYAEDDTPKTDEQVMPSAVAEESAAKPEEKPLVIGDDATPKVEMPASDETPTDESESSSANTITEDSSDSEEPTDEANPFDIASF